MADEGLTAGERAWLTTVFGRRVNGPVPEPAHRSRIVPLEIAAERVDVRFSDAPMVLFGETVPKMVDWSRVGDLTTWATLSGALALDERGNLSWVDDPSDALAVDTATDELAVPYETLTIDAVSRLPNVSAVDLLRLPGPTRLFIERSADWVHDVMSDVWVNRAWSA
jgi:hypothetical protein